MEIDRIIVGNRIKSLRKDLGLTQEGLATRLGLNNKSSISQYEKGDALPGDDIKFQMCKLFDCSMDYLLCKTDIKNPGLQIDDVLNEAMIGMSKKDYEQLTEVQKKQIRDFAIFVKNQNEGEEK